MTGWWSPSEQTTVLVDKGGDEVVRADGQEVTVPSFLPGSTAAWTTFDLAELDRAVEGGLTPFHTVGSDLDLLLWPAGTHPSVEASAYLLDAALETEPGVATVHLDAEEMDAAWAPSVRTTMVLDCASGIEVEVDAGDGVWSISHPLPLMIDLSREVHVEFRRAGSEPPSPDDRERLVLPDASQVDRLDPRPPSAPCRGPIVENPPTVDCDLIEPLGVERGPEPCEVFALLVERQGGERGAINISTPTPLTLAEALAFPLAGLEVTGLGLTIPSSSGNPTHANLTRLHPSATSPADAERILDEVNPLHPLDPNDPPTVEWLQVTGPWADLAEYVTRMQPYSLSLGRNQPPYVPAEG